MRTKKEIVINTLCGLLSFGFLFILLPSIFGWLLEKFPEQVGFIGGILLFTLMAYIIIIVPLIVVFSAIKDRILERKEYQK